MRITKFIIENWGKKIELSEEEKKFDELTQKYIEEFGEDFGTEAFDYTDQEWIEMLEYCLKHHVLMETLTGKELT